jgi:hypothetical protein
MATFHFLAGGANKSKIGAVVGAIIGGASFVAFVVLFVLWRRNLSIRETFYDVSGKFLIILVCSYKRLKCYKYFCGVSHCKMIVITGRIIISFNFFRVIIMRLNSQSV